MKSANRNWKIEHHAYLLEVLESVEPSFLCLGLKCVHAIMNSVVNFAMHIPDYFGHMYDT